MNLFYKSMALGAVLLWAVGLPQAAQALNITALYKGACNRSVGVILDVGEEKLTLLDLKGKFEEIDRFDVIYMASYPMGELFLPQIDRPALAPLEVRTRHQGVLKPLVQGWPIDFSEQEISFLSLNGRETIIRRDAIWDIVRQEELKPLSFGSTSGQQASFAHPYPFAHCAAQPKENRINPQQLLGDPLLIRRELDRMQGAYKVVEEYRENKVFYAVPQVYQNFNSLGLWFVSGTRYGASRSRVNSFIPSFVSQLSEGPFGFQRVLVTGTHPMPYSLHEEPQSQFYYRLKADYVHFSIMYDFDRLLLGEERYKWKPEDMGAVDFRLNELHHIMGGFDYDAWAIEYMWMPMQYGVNIDEAFFRHRVEINKMALSYRDLDLKAELHVGWSVDGKVDNIIISEGDSPEQIAEKERLRAEIAAAPNYLTKIRHYRFNLDLSETLPLEPEISLIHRRMDFTREADAPANEPAMRFKGTSTTLALWLRWPLPLDLSLGGFVGGEYQDYQWGVLELGESSQSLSPKGGLKVDLTF
ncbi:MAG: hypothetical protein RRB13_07695 [bacterium]|nr:hypothetical protein [bacterium]